MSALPEPFYVDEAVTLYHGDCLDLLPLIEAVDHTIQDPPYEDEAHTKGRRMATGTRPGHAVATWKDADGGMRVCDLPFAAITNECRDEVSLHVARLTRRWSLTFCQVEAAMRWRAALEAGGAVYKRTCVWVKPDGQPQFTGDRPGCGYESIVACHPKGRSRWNGGGRLGVFSFVKNVTGSREKAPHPTTKPLALMRELVRLFTDPGDLILDPFAGSGTTGLAARMEGRRAILIEREERYCEVAARRLERMPRGTERQPSLFAGVG